MIVLPEPLERFKEKAEDLLEELEGIRKTSAFPLLYSMNRFIARLDIDSLYEALSLIKNRKVDLILFQEVGTLIKLT